MAKWTGNIKVVKRWFRSDKLFVQFLVEEGDHNPPGCPDQYWEEVTGLRLDLIAFDLQCCRNEVETLEAENKRLREKLLSLGSDTKVEVSVSLPEVGVSVSSPEAAVELAVRLKRVMQQTACDFIAKHADWIRQPADVDLRTNADMAKRFAGGYQPVDMPEGAQPPKGR